MGSFTRTEHEILSALCWHIAAATALQLKQLVSDKEMSVAKIKRTIRRLESRQFVQRTSASLIIPKILQPLISWSPGRRPARLHRVAWKLEKRWQQRPVEHWVCWSTVKACRFFGGVHAGLRQPFQLQHDLGTTAVFLRLRKEIPRQTQWVSEDRYRKHFRVDRREKVADAVLMNAAHEIVAVHEFGGQYTADYLQQFHRYWKRKRIPYQIW